MQTRPDRAAPSVPASRGRVHDREEPGAVAPGGGGRPAATAPAGRAGTAGAAGMPRGAVVAAVAVGVLVVGVVAAVDPAGLRPYTTLRWAVVGVATAVVAAAVPWRPPRAIAGLAAGLLVWCALATATAHDPLTALVGHPRRHLGLAGWGVCALALLAGTGIADGVPRRLLGRTIAASGALTGATVLADVVGWDPFGTRFAGGRAGGLLGQPLYLAVVAVLVGPVAAAVAVDRTERRGWRVVGAAGCAGALLALAVSQTRGAWLGAAVATGLLIARRASRRGRRGEAFGGDAAASRSEHGDAVAAPTPNGRRGRAAAVAVGLAAALGLLLVAAGPRLADLADRDAAGGVGRLDEWRVAIGVVADHPVTGVGLDGYSIAAPSHIDDDYTRRHGRDEVVDRAHSAPLDVAAAAGVPAALLYVGLLGIVVVRCARVIGRSPDPVLVGVATAVVAWSVQLLVGFPIAEVDPLAWLLAGVVVAAPSARGSSWRDRASRMLAGAAAVVLGVGGLTGVVADRSLARAEAARARGDLGAALMAADRATALRPDDIDAWYLATRIAATPEGLPALDNGLDRVESGLDRLPDDPALRHLHTALLVERAQRSGLPDDVATAHASARALVADDPSSPAAHRALGLAAVAGGDTGVARAALARANDLDPDDPAARMALQMLDDEEAAG